MALWSRNRDVKTVYYFKVWDPEAEENVMPERPATLEAIEKVNGVPIMRTSLRVSDDEVDADGFVKP